MRGLIITGIDTGVGKTVVSAIFTKALNATYWKPIEVEESDTQVIRNWNVNYYPPEYQLCNVDQLLDILICTQLRQPPCFPIVIEGCGGVTILGSCFIQWQLPWIVVSKNYLGSINHTLLTVEWLKSRKQKIIGIVFNGEENAKAEHTILSQTALPCLGHLYPEKILNQKVIDHYANLFKSRLASFHSKEN